MLVCETFASIQGESSFAGRKCFFIRLSGCNLNCSYCDTGYARQPESGAERTVAELLEEANRAALPLVEITGGEPLCSPETPALCRALLDAGFEVLLETNGSLALDAIPAGVRKIVDCKLPGSGMSDRNCTANYALLTPRDEVKFVISDRGDFDYGCAVIEKYHLADRTPNLIAGPVWGRVDFAELAAWVMASPLPWRMQLQMHKVIWGDRRGV